MKKNNDFQIPDITHRRFEFIDNAKAIGIVLVVLGHTSGIPSWTSDLIFSFHMPLFFFVSGYLLSERKLQERTLPYCRQVLRNLGIPYLLFFGLSYLYWLLTRNLGSKSLKFAGVSWYDPLIGLVSGLGDALYVNPALWFFPTLITTTVLYHLIRKRLPLGAATLLLVAVGLVVCALADQVAWRLPLGLDNGWIALPFFAIGLWLRDRTTSRPALSPSAWGMLPVLALLPWWWLVQLNGHGDLNKMAFGHYPLLYLPTALLGILACLGLSAALPVTPARRWLAASTLVIFPTHALAFNLFSGIAKNLLHFPASIVRTLPWAVTVSVLAILLCIPAGIVLARLLPSVFRR